jgi:hypothetical protein
VDSGARRSAAAARPSPIQLVQSARLPAPPRPAQAPALPLWPLLPVDHSIDGGRAAGWQWRPWTSDHHFHALGRRVVLTPTPCVRLVVASTFTRMIRAGATRHAKKSTVNRVQRTSAGVYVCLLESPAPFRHGGHRMVAESWMSLIFPALFDSVWQVTQLHILWEVSGI